MQMRFPLSGKIFPWKKNSAAGGFLFFPGSKNRAVGWLDVHVRLSQEGFFGTFWSAAGERRGKAPIVVKVDKHGNRYHEPPYTQAEEDEFYRRVGGGRKFTLNPISPVQIPAVVQQALHPNNLVCPTALKPAFAERRTCRRRSDQCNRLP